MCAGEYHLFQWTGLTCEGGRTATFDFEAMKLDGEERVLTF